MNSTMIIRCPHCSEKMSVPSDYAGLESKCPKCRRGFVMSAEPAPPAPAPRVRASQPPAIPRPVTVPHPAVKSQNMRVAGWICFSVGMVLLVLCPIIPFYSPFFVAAFVLSVILLAKEEGRGGLALLLTTLLVPITLGAVIFVLGIGAMLAAFSGCVKEVENSQKSLAKQQAAFQSQQPGQQAPVFQPPAPQPTPPARQFVFQPPVAQVQKPPAAAPLPVREIVYDSLLLLLNRYGIEFKAATTTIQKQDIRARAQKEAAALLENAQMHLVGMVSDVRYGSDGVAELTVGKFDAPGYDNQAQKTLMSFSSTGKLRVPLTRDAALAVRNGQKVWITARAQLSQVDLLSSGFSEASSPSILSIMFTGDSDIFKLRLRDYTVSFEPTRRQASVPGKKKDYLIVVPPKASP